MYWLSKFGASIFVSGVNSDISGVISEILTSLDFF